MSNSETTVFIVDDDSGVRKSLLMLMRSVGIQAEIFGSAQEFLDAFDPSRSGCLVLDIRMPGQSGLDLQKTLIEMGASIPIIFITAHGDVPMAVDAMREGAVDFVQKPFREQELLDRIQKAIEIDAQARQSFADQATINERIEKLTPRERQVLDRVVAGDPNKAIAYDFSLSERTVEIHRANVMRKMEATSLPHLVQMVLSIRK